MSPPAPLVAAEMTRIGRRVAALAVIAQDYPAWRISRPVGSDGLSLGVWAVRYRRLTQEQRAAGLVPSIARWDLVALISELGVQDHIAHRCGYSPGAGS